MHNTERLHLPIIQCLSNDNSPMFIDPYNTGPIYIARTLRSAVYCATVLWHAVRVLYCITQYFSLQSNIIIYYTECGAVQYSAMLYNKVLYSTVRYVDIDMPPILSSSYYPPFPIYQ